MKCEMTSDSAERYVSGTMPDGERSSFEDHFFICDRCFQAVQALQDATAVLGADPAVSARPLPEATVSPRRLVPAPWMALAAMLVVAVGVGLSVLRLPRDTVNAPESTPAPAAAAPSTPVPPSPVPSGPTTDAPAPAPTTSSSTPAPRSNANGISTLARVTPPPYVALTTRSEADAQAQAFDAAMAQYSKGDYRRAARALRELVTAAPGLAHAQFFLGVSELMQQNADGARAALQRAVDSAAAPYADEAHFYLGKAALQAGDVDAARREFRLAVDVEAGPRGEAARLLRELETMRR
jgi:tetratricopeptide (TPR) repeat protein